MKLSSLIATLAIILVGAFAHAETEGGHGGNGGGLINRNGRLMTFYSAGFYTEPVEATSDEVPQLSQLLDFFNKTTVITELTKVKYASSLMPSSIRHYYKVKEDSFTPEVRNNLMAVYSRQMKVDASQIALAAITDTESKTTYLLPNFYKLTPIEQQTILFHETFWVLNPTSTYQDVVNTEMIFQAYLSQPNSPERILRFAKALGSEGDVWTAAIRSDLATNALAGFTAGSHYERINHQKVLVSGSVITLGQILGPKAIECIGNSVGEACASFVATYQYELSKQYPRSLFLKLVNDYVVRGAYRMQYIFSYPKDISWESQLPLDLKSIGYTQSTEFKFINSRKWSRSIDFDNSYAR